MPPQNSRMRQSKAWRYSATFAGIQKAPPPASSGCPPQQAIRQYFRSWHFLHYSADAPLCAAHVLLMHGQMPQRPRGSGKDRTASRREQGSAYLMGNLFLGQAQTNRIHTIQGINGFKLDPASSVSCKSFKNKHRIPFSKEKTQCCIRYPRRKIGTASKRLAILFQTVKKLHSCLIAYVGATIGRPPTYRSNAFSGTVFCKANGHGRAMLAPTRVFRQSEFYLPISFIVKWLRRWTKGYTIKQPNMDCQPTEITALMRHRAVFS